MTTDTTDPVTFYDAKLIIDGRSVLLLSGEDPKHRVIKLIDLLRENNPLPTISTEELAILAEEFGRIDLGPRLRHDEHYIDAPMAAAAAARRRGVNASLLLTRHVGGQSPTLAHVNKWNDPDADLGVDADENYGPVTATSDRLTQLVHQMLSATHALVYVPRNDEGERARVQGHIDALKESIVDHATAIAGVTIDWSE